MIITDLDLAIKKLQELRREAKKKHKSKGADYIYDKKIESLKRIFSESYLNSSLYTGRGARCTMFKVEINHDGFISRKKGDIVIIPVFAQSHYHAHIKFYSKFGRKLSTEMKILEMINCEHTIF